MLRSFSLYISFIEVDTLLLTGRRTSGSFLFRCSFPIGVIICPSLLPPSQGSRIRCSGNKTMYYDTVCQFSCNDGYIGSGSQVRRCQYNGIWSGQEYICQRTFDCVSLINTLSFNYPKRASWEKVKRRRSRKRETIFLNQKKICTAHTVIRNEISRS